jgi:hypothetical protein
MVPDEMFEALIADIAEALPVNKSAVTFVKATVFAPLPDVLIILLASV